MSQDFAAAVAATRAAEAEAQAAFDTAERAANAAFDFANLFSYLDSPVVTARNKAETTLREATEARMRAEAAAYRAAAALTTQQAATELQITPARVRILIKEGRLPATKIGRDWMIAPADLDLVRDRPTGYPAGKPRK